MCYKNKKFTWACCESTGCRTCSRRTRRSRTGSSRSSRTPTSWERWGRWGGEKSAVYPLGNPTPSPSHYREIMYNMYTFNRKHSTSTRFRPSSPSQCRLWVPGSHGAWCNSRHLSGRITLACVEACIGREEVYVWPTACIERPTQAGIAGRGGGGLTSAPYCSECSRALWQSVSQGFWNGYSEYIYDII